MRRFLTLLAIVRSTLSFGQQVTLPLDTWKAFPIPTNEDTLFKFNSAPDDWTVLLKENTLYVTNAPNKTSDTLPFNIPVTSYRQFGGRKSVLEVDDGYLVGFYRGEFGGNLHWFSKDGKSNYEISGHKIVQFIKRSNKIYAIEGLAHLGLSSGSIIEVRKMNNKWTALNYLRLPSAPDGIDLDSQNNFIIITSESLLSVDTNKNIDTLITKGFWSALLYPTSIVVKDKIAYVGMRKGILKFNLTTHKQEWLLND